MEEFMESDTESVTSSKRILYTPSEVVHNNFIYVQEAGKLKSIKPHISRRSELDSFLFFVITKGAGTLKTRNNDYHIEQGDAVLLNCMDLYEHISDEKTPWELSWIHFNGGNAKAFFDLFSKYNDGKSVFKCRDYTEYDQFIEHILEFKNNVDIIDELKIADIVNHLLTNVISETKLSNEHNGQINLSELREVINLRFTESDLFEKLCNQYGLDEMTINEKYREKYGIDMCDYILNRRFTYAKELLRFSVKTVRDIVHECGIDNADLFRHMFITNEGMTAEEYRKKWSQWNRE